MGTKQTYLSPIQIKKIILEKFGLVEEFHINWEKMIDLIAN